MPEHEDGNSEAYAGSASVGGEGEKRTYSYTQDVYQGERDLWGPGGPLSPISRVDAEGKATYICVEG